MIPSQPARRRRGADGKQTHASEVRVSRISHDSVQPSQAGRD